MDLNLTGKINHEMESFEMKMLSCNVEDDVLL